MCSRSREHTGLIIHPSLPLALGLEFEPLTLAWFVIIGDFGPCMFKSFLLEGAGDLKMLLPLEIGVELRFGCDLLTV